MGGLPVWSCQSAALTDVVPGGFSRYVRHAFPRELRAGGGEGGGKGGGQSSVFKMLFLVYFKVISNLIIKL